MIDQHIVQGTGPASAGPVLRRSPSNLRGSLKARRARSAAQLHRTITRLADVDTSANPGVQGRIAPPKGKQLSSASGVALVLIGLVLIGFVVQTIGISQLRHTRDQTLLYEQFRYSLADATAPVAQVDENDKLYPLGTPVAIVAIPSIGVNEVVLEGTASRTMLSGPGHRRDTALPGQAGSAVVMGRQGSYGGPFRHIASLSKGDTITTTTGQGIATYVVDAVRFAGDPQPLAPDEGTGRLTLVTASGPIFAPDGVVRVDATLKSTPFETPQAALLVGSLGDDEMALGSDESGWLPLLLILELVVAAVFLFTLAVRRWGRWHTWVVAVPVSLLLGCTMAEQVTVLLPNLY